MNRERYTRLEQIPNVGRASAEDLRLVGVSHPRDLIGRDPYAMYEELCRKTQQRHDPCVIDVFISAVRFMQGEPKRPWWAYTSERKHTLAGKDALSLHSRRVMEVIPIGVIHSPYHSKDECPIQPAYASGAEGRVEVFPAYAAGLQDVETFTHIYLLYSFDRAGDIELVRPTFLDDAPHGVFSSRHPCRPNGIGLSVVRLLERQDNVLVVSGIDVLDQTPLLDIKPYMPRYDAVESASMGWASDLPWRPKPSDRE